MVQRRSIRGLEKVEVAESPYMARDSLRVAPSPAVVARKCVGGNTERSSVPVVVNVRCRVTNAKNGFRCDDGGDRCQSASKVRTKTQTNEGERQEKEMG